MNQRKYVAIAFASAFPLLAGGATMGAEPLDADMDDDPAIAAGAELTVGAPKDLKDVAIAAAPLLSEASNAIAANPKHLNVLVAGAARGSVCVVYLSGDGGRTWSKPVRLPLHANSLLGFGASCTGLDVAYARDGRRIYAAYAGFLKDYSGVILVSRSDDDGKTWHIPLVVLNQGGGGSYYPYVRLKIATPLREADGNWVYLTAKQDVEQGYWYDEFTRSADRGTSWSALLGIVSGSYDDKWISSGTVAGGVAGEVLVAWWEKWSGEPAAIKIARSRDYGATFDPALTAATTDANTPDIKIGAKGVAHIVYGFTAGSGAGVDIGYIWSAPPYAVWSQPVTVNDHGLQMADYGDPAPSLATQKCGASTLLHVVWQDERVHVSPNGYEDSYRNTFYAHKVAKPGASWSKNIRVSDNHSLYSYDMSPRVAVSQGRLFAAWTDRRDKTDPDDRETDFYGSGILSGVTCP